MSCQSPGNPIRELTRISDHTYGYLGFLITRIDRSKINPITRYHVRQGDESYGKFDALAQAIEYIDQLYELRG
ncbi:hypothetical protein [Yersinia massiliensis]|uniref:hypothetical protein n=1 Tax=Yersinia massiliensis TaxID=419257 RepID=UPI0002D3DE9A|nr:hypothetical protein [Yersinia massiliensis]